MRPTLFVDRMKGGIVLGVIAVGAITGLESLCGFQLGRDGFALLVLLAGIFGASIA